MDISYGNGEVYLEHNSKIVALQIHFYGIIDIKSELPDESKRANDSCNQGDCE